MMLNLKMGGVSKTLSAKEGDTILEVLRSEGISPDVTIVFRGEHPIPLDSQVEEGMVLRVVSVVSGG